MKRRAPFLVLLALMGCAALAVPEQSVKPICPPEIIEAERGTWANLAAPEEVLDAIMSELEVLAGKMPEPIMSCALQTKQAMPAEPVEQGGHIVRAYLGLAMESRAVVIVGIYEYLLRTDGTAYLTRVVIGGYEWSRPYNGIPGMGASFA